MTDNIINTLIISCSLIWAISFLFLIVLWKFRKKITREFFAAPTIIFAVSSFLLFFSFFFVGIYFINLYPFIGQYSNSTWIKDISNEALKSMLIFILSSSWVVFICIQGHKNWVKNNGLKSINQFFNEKDKIEANIGYDFKILFTNFKLTKKHIETDDFKIGSGIETIKFTDNKKWREHAIELLNLSSKQFNISENEFDNKFYNSIYGKDNENIGVYCTDKQPTLSETYKLVDYYKKQSKDKIINRIIFAIKEGNEPKSETIINDIYVELRFKNEIVKSLIDFTLYENEIIKNYTNPIPFGNDKTSIHDIFVEPTISKVINSKQNITENIEKPINYVLNWLISENQNKQLAVLGEYGQGKSVLMQHLTYQLIQNKELGIIPFIIELRGIKPAVFNNKFEFLSIFTSKYRIDTNALIKLSELGKVLFIFDGFDEMDLQGDYETRKKNFEMIWCFAENSKFVITGRPNFFLHDLELRSLLNISQKDIDRPYCEELHINMFKTNQIELALRAFDNNKKLEILELYNKSSENSNFRDLISRPSLLFMTSIIWNEIKQSQKQFDINSAFIIEKYLEYTYKRQENKKINHVPLTTNQRAYFIQGIAISIYLKKGFTNQIALPELNSIINELVDKVDNSIFQIDNYQTVKYSFDDIRKEKNLLLNDIKTCGIITRDFSGDDLYMFSHKSFLDYLLSHFAICQLINDTDKNRQLIVNTISKQLNTNILQLNHNTDTIKFTSEILINRTEVNIEKYSEKQKYKKLFKAIYPVKILDNHPELAFLSLSNFKKSLIISFLFAVLTIISSFVEHEQFLIEIVLFSLLAVFLFGVRFWFRVFYLLGYVAFLLLLFKILSPFYSQSTSNANVATSNSSPDIISFIYISIPIIFWFVMYKFYLLKPLIKLRNPDNFGDYFFFGKNKQLFKLLQLWYFACISSGVSENTLSKIITQRTRQKLMKI